MTAINQNLATPKSRESGSSKTISLTHTQHALNNPKSRKRAMNTKCWDCFRPYKFKETANTLTGVAVSDLSYQQNHEVNTK